MEANGAPLVLVTWVDSSSASAWEPWEDIEDTPEPMLCYSVGWIRHSNPENLTLVANVVTEEGGKQATGLMVIPVRAITQIQPLQIKKKRS